MSDRRIYTENIFIELARLLAYPLMKKKFEKMIDIADDAPELQKDIKKLSDSYAKMAKGLAEYCHNRPDSAACKEFWGDPDKFYRLSDKEQYRKKASDYKGT